MTELRLATRRSSLALAQAEIVAKALADRGITTSVVPITTTGDRDRHSSVTSLTEVGAFVRGVQEAVLDGRADVCVHSCKDLPIEGPADLIAFYPERAAPWDALCGAGPDDLPAGARVGTGSPRRAAQLRLLRPDMEPVAIRGNVETRLGKVASQEVEAVVLAEAGLVRLGFDHEIRHRFSIEEMVPAPAQGVIAVEVPRGAGDAIEALRGIDDPATRLAVEGERALLARTGAGCRSALGAYASAGHSITMWGFVDDERGARRALVEADSPQRAAAALQRELGL